MTGLGRDFSGRRARWPPRGSGYENRANRVRGSVFGMVFGPILRPDFYLFDSESSHRMGLLLAENGLRGPIGPIL